MSDPPILQVSDLTVRYGDLHGCRGVSFSLWPGEALAIVGESGSGKTTLLNAVCGRVGACEGAVLFRDRYGETRDLASMPDSDRRRLVRREIGFVHQNPRDGLRLSVSAGANVAEPIMSAGARNYEKIRVLALDWLGRVEIASSRIDDLPATFSGGMQQRLQIARALVTEPRLVLMDEPTGGLDVSVQARLLDLIRRLCGDLGLAAIVVTHDLGVARLLAHRMLVMQAGAVIERGVTDQVLDDPQHPYTQLLVASALVA